MSNELSLNNRPAGATIPAPLTRPRPLRVGVVAYLNMQPLVYGLSDAYAPEELEVRVGPPSRLAQWLADGELDLGMVPVASLFAHPEWSVAGRSMIGSRGAVQSVLLMGGHPCEDWRLVHPDSHSLTSNALAQVLLRRHYQMDFRLGEPTPLEGWEPPPLPAPGEAYVLIGSRALRWRNRWCGGRTKGCGCVLDMGGVWGEWTGLPFVYAVWAARPGVDLGAWPERLEAHKLANRARTGQIARAWPDLEDNRLSPAEAEAYLTESIQYDLDGPARAGLERFYEEGRALGVFSGAWQWNPYVVPRD